MYRQVTAWLLHGMLLDRHAEFFIHQTTEPGQLLTPSPDDDDLGLGGVTSTQLQDIMVRIDIIPMTHGYNDSQIYAYMFLHLFLLRRWID